MKKLIESIKYWGQVFLLPIYWFSFLIPRDKHIWLFGSTFGKRFADNPRYFYLYLNQYKKKEIRAIWISHKKEIVNFLNRNGYEAYYFLSLKGIWYCLRGKIYLFDNYSKDINFWTSGGAKKINLWHGIPLKKIQADNRFDEIRHPAKKTDKIKYFLRYMSDEKPSHYVLTTSRFLIPIFSSAFQTKHVFASGYPRNDMLISKKIKNIYTKAEMQSKRKIELFRKHNLDIGKNSKVILYMPTFRDSESKFFDVINFNKFYIFLEENNLLFCVKLHPKSKLKERFKQLSGGYFQVLDSNVDPYALLKLMDVLITDYSSIYFDFLLLDRPIIFFNYDLKEYLEHTRELYFNYNKFTPGEKAKTMEELQAAICKACDANRSYTSYYKRLRSRVVNKVLSNHKILASKMLEKDILKILNNKELE